MDRIRKAIEAFWAGKLNRKQQQQLLEELNRHHPEWKKELAEEFDVSVEHAEQPLDPKRSRQVLAAIQNRLQPEEPEKPQPRLRRITWAAAAAAVALFCTLGYWLSMRTGGGDARMAYIAPDTLQLTNAGKDTAYYRFRDGSTVKLFPKASLRYTSDYGEKNRSIQLDGTAFFSVAKNADLPFSVSANGYITTALGTSFVVNTQPNGGVVVQLMSGKVVVQPSPDNPSDLAATELVPGEELLAGGQHERFIVRRIKVDKPVRPVTVPKLEKPMETQSRNDALVFEQMPLAEVFGQLSARLNVTIDIQRADLSDLTFTGAFGEDDSLETILTVICKMNNLRYEHSGNRVTIDRRIDESRHND